jgi:K+-transporting ATPase KdpF subunit
MSTFQVAGAVVAAALFFYLLFAMLKPEKLS